MASSCQQATVEGVDEALAEVADAVEEGSKQGSALPYGWTAAGV